MIRSRLSAPRRRNAPRPAWKVAKAYGQWLRGRECAFRSVYCWGSIEAAHTPDPKSKGLSTKAADCNMIPACQYHHRLQTNNGWSAVGLTRESAARLSDTYWRAWPGRREWERKLADG